MGGEMEFSLLLRRFTSWSAYCRCGTSPAPRRFHRRFLWELASMIIPRSLKALVAACAVAAIAGCQTAPPPPMVVPASFTPLGVNAPYLMGDVIGGTKARAAKMRAAKIRPLGPGEVAAYMADLESELRRQTAGIGLDVLQVGGGIVIRIPAIFTFDPSSATIKATTDATLLEIARTVKTRNRTYVDVLAHTDTSGSPEGNLALSQKRAAAVATYLTGHGVAKARIASHGLGEAVPLYNPDDTEDQKAANRRIEIRLVPYRG
jgi:outer membrane protein OmpA-like peptidoglycan-associated protein